MKKSDHRRWYNVKFKLPKKHYDLTEDELAKEYDLPVSTVSCRIRKGTSLKLPYKGNGGMKKAHGILAGKIRLQGQLLREWKR